MKKLPPIEKIYEAYSAIADHRVVLYEDSAEIVSSSHSKTYFVTWNGNTYTSNDSATYWQGYAGYPVLAVLMLQGRLPLNPKTAEWFRKINWTQLNARYKAEYSAAVGEVFRERIPADRAEEIRKEVQQVVEGLQGLELTIKRGTTRPLSAESKKKNAALRKVKEEN